MKNNNESINPIHGVSEAIPRLTALLDCRCDVPVEHSLSDYDIALLWLRMKQQGLDKYIFCSGDIDSYSTFRDFVRNPTIWCYAGFSKHDGEPVALGILDRIIGRSAYLHYTFFRTPESIENKEKYAEVFFDLLFENRTLDALILLTPSIFRHSNAFALSMGAEYLCQLPSVIPVRDFKTYSMAFPKCNMYLIKSKFYQTNIT